MLVRIKLPNGRRPGWLEELEKDHGYLWVAAPRTGNDLSSFKWRIRSVATGMTTLARMEWLEKAGDAD